MIHAIITTVAIAVAILCAYKLLIVSGRLANVEILNAELRASLDDATRTADRYRTSNSLLIAEATTLALDLATTEQRRSHLQSRLQQGNGALAGALLLSRQHMTKEYVS